MTAEAIALYVEHHERFVRAAMPWLAVAHVSDDADPALIPSGHGARVAGFCRQAAPTPSCRPDGRFHHQFTPSITQPTRELVSHESGHQAFTQTVDREGTDDQLALVVEWAELIGRPELAHDSLAGEYWASGLTKALTGNEGGYIVFGAGYPVAKAQAWYVALDTWRNKMLRTHITATIGLTTDASGYAETTITLPEFDPTKQTVVDVYRVGLAAGEKYQGHTLGQAGFVQLANGQTVYGARIRVVNDTQRGSTAYLQARAQQQL